MESGFFILKGATQYCFTLIQKTEVQRNWQRNSFLSITGEV